MSLDIQATKQEIMERYSNDARAGTTSFLVYGGAGTGKTSLIETARKPILIHSFDPGGSRSIDPALIKSGDVLIDNRFEVENPMRPSAFDNWKKEYERLINGEFFNHIGTYAIDSLTTWAQSAMNKVLATAGRAGGVPQQNDWYPQMIAIEKSVRSLLELPCDKLLTAHADSSKDEITGKIYRTLLITGKLNVRIPAMFDEFYLALTKETSKGSEYYLQTQGDSTSQARTRLGRKGGFDKLEKPDIKYLLAKAGMDASDKTA